MSVKKLLPVVILAALFWGFVFFWQQVPLPCGKPIAYSVGTFDSRFGLSEEQFLQEASSAEAVWENVLGKDLFRYVPDATFKLNLIFDERQERTVEGQRLSQSFDTTQTNQEYLSQKQAKISTQYRVAVREYERQLSSFKKRLNAYNADVEKWNELGGAPPDEYRDLRDVAATLKSDQKELEKGRQQVNALAEQVNTFSKQKVALVEMYNAQVEQFNGRYGSEPRQFDQGVYAGQEINIYQYDDLLHLRAVLAHEFGHALGLSHDNEPLSLMYPIMKDQPLDPPVLSDEDKEILFAQCHQTVWDIIWERLGLLHDRVWGQGG